MAENINISDPDILLDLGSVFISFAEDSDRILSESIAEINRAENWLRHQRQPECKRIFIKCEQVHGEARIRYLAAKSRAPKMGRPMIEDEEKEWKRARYQLEAAEHKLKTVNQAILDFPRLVEHAANQIRMARNHYKDLLPQAVARLDQMIEALQKYFEQSGQNSGQKSGQKSNPQNELGSDK